MVVTDANRQTEIEVDATTRLRPWRADDLDSLLLHADDEQVSRGTRARFPFPYTRADGGAFLAGPVADLAATVVAMASDGKPDGGLGGAPGPAAATPTSDTGHAAARPER